MLKFLLFIIAFFFVIRFINRLFLPASKRQNHFNPFSSGRGNSRRKNFDQIEDAEFEDLSEKEK